MLCTRAEIRLFKVRKKSKPSGYHPLFNFVPESKAGGRIRLIDRDELKPGEASIVEIWFPVAEFLGANFGVEKKFTIDEGSPTSIGEGVVMEVSECTPPFPNG